MKNGWKLSCPVPATGVLAEGVYNAGAGLADDIFTATAEDSYMQILTEQGVADYEAYIELLKQAGYEQVGSNQLGDNLYADFAKDATVVHVSFVATAKELRVVEDKCSMSPKDFSYEKNGEAKTTIYQYGLYYDPLNRVVDNTAVNCGMLYVIKLSDNSLFMVDGGHLYQCTDEMIEALWKFLHEITQTPDGETIRIAAWYITHAHGDHVTACSKLLKRYHDKIDLQRMMYNFPSYQVRPGGYDDLTTIMKNVVRAWYPNVPFLKLHTGQKIQFADMTIDVLYTHEDAVKAENPTIYPLGDYNCTSSILRLDIEGKMVLMLGDANVEAEAIIAKTSQSSVWKGDLVQVAHHCFNYLNTLYPWIAAPVVFLPNSYYGAHTPGDNEPKLRTILAHVKNDQIYYEGEGTYGLQVQDDGFVCVYEAPVVGGEYDGSGI